jgi:hypothetical protein
VVYVVMAVEAALGQLNDPARNALVPSLVRGDDLVGANALIGLNSNLARLVGSPLGGVLVELAGLPGLVVGDAVSFLLGATLIALVRPPQTVPSTPHPAAPPGPDADAPSGRAPASPSGRDPVAPSGRAPAAFSGPDSAAPPRPRRSAPWRSQGPRRGSVADRDGGRRRLSTALGGVGREWVDGLRVTVRDHGLRWGLVVNGMAAVAQGIFTVLFVLFVAEELGGDGAEVGLLRGVQAIGGLLGGVLVVGLARRLEPGRLLGSCLLAFALVDLAIWNGPLVTTATWLYLGLFVAAGIPGVGILTGLTALVQERTGEAYLGRVFATFFGSFNGLMALGMLAAGLLGDAVGVVAVLNGQALIGLLAGLVALATLGRRARPGLRQGAAARSPTP